jgi:hypothetical protein
MSKIYVEVRPRVGDGDDELAAVPTIPELLDNRIDELGESISEVASKLQKYMDKLGAEKPANKWALGELELKFSIDLESEAGVIVARAKASAGFEASLKWTLR